MKFDRGSKSQNLRALKQIKKKKGVGVGKKGCVAGWWWGTKAEAEGYGAQICFLLDRKQFRMLFAVCFGQLLGVVTPARCKRHKQ